MMLSAQAAPVWHQPFRGRPLGEVRHIVVILLLLFFLEACCFLVLFVFPCSEASNIDDDLTISR
jgi:hypothetical protein